MDFEEYWY